MIGWDGVWQVLSGAVGSLGFAIMFNVRGYKLVAITLGGGVAWLLYLLLFVQALCLFLL